MVSQISYQLFFIAYNKNSHQKVAIKFENEQ